MADDHHRPAVEAGEATDDGGVVGIGAVAVQFLEVGADALHIVQRVGPLRMARELGDLPGAELGEDRLGQRAALLLQPADLLADVDLGVVAEVAQLLDLGLELGDGLFEIQEIKIHRD